MWPWWCSRAGKIIYKRQGSKTSLAAAKRRKSTATVFDSWKIQTPFCVQLAQIKEYCDSRFVMCRKHNVFDLRRESHVHQWGSSTLHSPTFHVCASNYLNNVGCSKGSSSCLELIIIHVIIHISSFLEKTYITVPLTFSALMTFEWISHILIPLGSFTGEPCALRVGSQSPLMAFQWHSPLADKWIWQKNCPGKAIPQASQQFLSSFFTSTQRGEGKKKQSALPARADIPAWTLPREAFFSPPPKKSDGANLSAHFITIYGHLCVRGGKNKHKGGTREGKGWRSTRLFLRADSLVSGGGRAVAVLEVKGTLHGDEVPSLSSMFPEERRMPSFNGHLTFRGPASEEMFVT